MSKERIHWRVVEECSIVAESESELRAVLARHFAFWQRADVDRALLWTTPYIPWSEPGPYVLSDGAAVGDGMRIEPGMLDLEAALRCAAVQRQPSHKLRETMTGLEQTLYVGRAVAVLDGDFVAVWEPYPFPWMEAILGCPVRHEKGAFWAAPLPGD